MNVEELFENGNYANNNTCAMITEGLIERGQKEEIEECIWHTTYMFLHFFQDIPKDLESKLINDCVSVLTSRAYGTTKAIIPIGLRTDEEVMSFGDQIEELEVTNTMVKVATSCMFAVFLQKYSGAPINKLFDESDCE